MPTAPPSDESESDYRMSLAAERTYLAYVRTALALLAGGVAVVGALPAAGYDGLRRTIGIILVVGGLLIGVSARLRWRGRYGNATRRTPATQPHCRADHRRRGRCCRARSGVRLARVVGTLRPLLLSSGGIWLF